MQQPVTIVLIALSSDLAAHQMSDNVSYLFTYTVTSLTLLCIKRKQYNQTQRRNAENHNLLKQWLERPGTRRKEKN